MNEIYGSLKQHIEIVAETLYDLTTIFLGYEGRVYTQDRTRIEFTHMHDELMASLPEYLWVEFLQKEPEKVLMDNSIKANTVLPWRILIDIRRGILQWHSYPVRANSSTAITRTIDVESLQEFIQMAYMALGKGDTQ